MTQGDMLRSSGPPEESRRTTYSVDYTPTAIARQTYAVLEPELGAVRRILCPAAGAGGWAMVAREFWPNAHITAVEIRSEEWEHLTRWCDSVIIGDIRDATHGLAECHDTDKPFDLIADNPPFSMRPASGGRKSQAEALRSYVVDLRPLLAHGGRLALYWLSDLAQRAPESRAILAAHPPLYQMRTQPTRHRATGGVDLRSYSVWVWKDGRARTKKEIEHDPPPRWAAFDLPPLDASERRWTVVPGTEPSPCGRGTAPGSETA